MTFSPYLLFTVYIKKRTHTHSTTIVASVTALKTLYTRTRITNPIARIRSLARCLSRGAKRLCGGEKISGNNKIRLGKDLNVSPSMNVVPKGHLVVHVGELDGDTRRVVVPLIYFNHPLFGELLEQAELVYGFDQLGRITILCRVSGFEKV
ncbi:hypothetical protein IGI04_007021 [Brassica rapa subsp. trilocularis]|nr:hypothetical protein IGI04_007021 [Brassica rapa subsp. trilocularis]